MWQKEEGQTTKGDGKVRADPADWEDAVNNAKLRVKRMKNAKRRSDTIPAVGSTSEVDRCCM